MKSPYKGKFRVSQQYKGSAHDGLDLVGITSKNIYSTVDGVVEKAGWENALNHKQGFGLYVRIKRNNSVDRYYFGHMSKVLVKKGQAVKVGDIIGIEGSTGKSTGSHCHYCARGNGSKSQIKDICAISGITNAIGTYEAAAEKISVKYQTWDDLKNNWLPNVFDNEDYAGIFGHSVCAIFANLSKGNIYYRVHTKGGKWLPEVKNREDYAGIYNKPIDAVMFRTDTGEKIKYKVHIKGRGWLPSVSGYSKTDKINGYAGIIGSEIDAVQIWLE